MTRLSRVLNQTIAEQAELAHSLWSRFKGLMLRKPLPAGEAIWIKPTSSVHTAFMRFPIDVVFVDRSNDVKVVRGLRPFRAASSRGHSALELPAGAAKRAAMEQGDVLQLEDVRR